MTVKWLDWPLGILAFGLLLAANSPVQAQQQTDQAPVSTTEANRDSLPDAPVSHLDSSRSPARHLTFGDRFDLYFHSMISPETVVGPAFGAAIDQGLNTPKEWGQGSEGYARRFASSYGRAAISRTIRFGVAAVDHEDPRFARSDASGVWPRTKSAILRTFITRTDTGSRIPAFSVFAGAYGSAFISNTWYPQSQSDAPHALERGSVSIATTAGWNVFHEFWPDIRNKFHHK